MNKLQLILIMKDDCIEHKEIFLNYENERIYIFHDA